MVNVKDLVGVAYVNGGRSVTQGLDCWGLVREYYRRGGIALPKFPINATHTDEVMDEIEKNQVNWEKLEEPEIGCVVLLMLIGNPLPSHCGVYLGYGEFIHAIAPYVQIDRLSRWGPRVVGYYKPKEGVYPHV